MDQTTYVKTGLRKRMPDFDNPHVRVCADLVIAEDLQRRLVNEASGGSKHCAEVEAKIRERLKNTPAGTLDILAKRWGYRPVETLAEPGYGKRSEILQQPKPGYQGWMPTGGSKYEHLAEGPAATVDPKFAPGRSRYADVQETPRLRDGSIDYAKLNEMNGHNNSRVNPRWR
jgi:hypothetical protein